MTHVGQRIENTENAGVPPNTAVAASESHYVTAVDEAVNYVDRDAGEIAHTESLPSFFGPVLRNPDDARLYDPRAAYDQIDDSFYLLAAVREEDGGEVHDTYYVVAASQSADPAGDWNLTRIDADQPDGHWVEFPGLAWDENHVYLTGNVFEASDEFQRAQFVGVDKHELLWRSEVTYNLIDGLETSDGTPAFRTFPSQNYGWGTSGTAWLIWASSTGGSTVEVLEVPDPLQSGLDEVVAHAVDVPDYRGVPGAAEQIDTNATLRVIGSCFVRRGVIVDDSLWCAHAVGYDTDGDGELETRIDWYEIDLGGPVEAVQASDVTPTEGSVWAPAVEHDGSGRTAIVSTYSSPTGVPKLLVHHRRPWNGDGVMYTDVLHESDSSYDPELEEAPWGDYNGVARDPTADGQFVGYGQYAVDESVNGNYGRVTTNFGV